MSGRSAKDYEDDYTEPELRARLKDEIKTGEKGGRSGQWSARKSQLLTHEYEAQGGGYWELLSDAEQAATDRRKHRGSTQHVSNTEAAQQARAAAELLDVDADEARRRVRRMLGADQLDRAERAESELGRDRKTVLEQIERQREH